MKKATLKMKMETVNIQIYVLKNSHQCVQKIKNGATLFAVICHITSAVKRKPITMIHFGARLNSLKMYVVSPISA